MARIIFGMGQNLFMDSCYPCVAFARLGRQVSTARTVSGREKFSAKPYVDLCCSAARRIPCGSVCSLGHHSCFVEKTLRPVPQWLGYTILLLVNGISRPRQCWLIGNSAQPRPWPNDNDREDFPYLDECINHPPTTVGRTLVSVDRDAGMAKLPPRK